MPSLVLVRHGQSLWNAENKFTGWTDVDLSHKGQAEARQAGQILSSLNFDVAWTSILKRAYHTLDIILNEIQQTQIPAHRSWRLNERHYGKLQGLNKQKAKDTYGEEQVFQWRRSFKTLPPLLSQDEVMEYGKEDIFKTIPKDLLPRGESLENTLKRVLPLWEKDIMPLLKSHKNILIVAHGNSVRSLIKHIQKIDDDSICKLEIPTATPFQIKWSPQQNIQDIPQICQFLKPH